MNESNVADAARLSHLEAENAALKARVAELEPWAKFGKCIRVYYYVVRHEDPRYDASGLGVLDLVYRLEDETTIDAHQARTIAAEFGITLPGEEKE